MSRVPEYRATGKNTPYKVPAKSREEVGAVIFMINNENFLCIVDYHSKFLVVKKVESMSAKDLIQATKVIFAKFG